MNREQLLSNVGKLFFLISYGYDDLFFFLNIETYGPSVSTFGEGKMKCFKLGLTWKFCGFGGGGNEKELKEL